MNISEPFIERPVATSLLMVGVLLMGLLGYYLLPISALPPVDFPTIQVVAQYPGANPDVMASSVTTPLERQFGQISGLGMMTSVSSFGNMSITLQFNLERDIDAAAQDVPAAIAARNIGFEDIRSALTQNNVNAPKGNFDGPRQSYAIGANDQIFSAAEYANVIIAYKNGLPVRLRDVGEVIDNVENVRLAGWVGHKPAVILDVQRQPGANIIQTADRVKALLPKLRASIPPSVKVAILTDRTETIRASVRDVQLTLLLTVALVVMVIFVFLRKLW